MGTFIPYQNAYRYASTDLGIAHTCLLAYLWYAYRMLELKQSTTSSVRLKKAVHARLRKMAFNKKMTISQFVEELLKK